MALNNSEAPKITHYRDVELVSLISADSAALRRFVARELASLAFPDPTTQRLRETLLAYFQTGSSAKAATNLHVHVHKNTILYRLQRAEELLSHKTDQRALEVEVAPRTMAVHNNQITRT